MHGCTDLVAHWVVGARDQLTTWKSRPVTYISDICGEVLHVDDSGRQHERLRVKVGVRPEEEERGKVSERSLPHVVETSLSFLPAAATRHTWTIHFLFLFIEHSVK